MFKLDTTVNVRAVVMYFLALNASKSRPEAHAGSAHSKFADAMSVCLRPQSFLLLCGGPL